MWHEDTKFRAVIVRSDDPKVEHQRLPDRDTLVEVKLDILCFQHQCRCEKFPRPTGCLRYTKVEPKDAQVTAYIDNDRGYRSWLTSNTIVPLLPKEDE
jgi:hypothetical protein